MAGHFVVSPDSQVDPVAASGPTLLQTLWLRRRLLVVITVASLIVGFVVSSQQPATFTASATVYLTDPSDARVSRRSTADAEQYVGQQAERIGSRAMYVGAAELLDRGLRAVDIAQRIEISSDAQAGLITVTASAGTPGTAADVANAVVRSYRQARERARTRQLDTASEAFERQMSGLREEAGRLRTRAETRANAWVATSSLQAIEAQLAVLTTRLSEVVTEVALYGTGVDRVEVARPPTRPSSPRPVRDASLAAVLGFVLAAVYAYWRSGSRYTARTDAGDLLGAPLLARIPAFRVDDDAPWSVDDAALEAYQFLVSSVESALSRAGGRSVLITSALPREGKSRTALRLAEALATQGRDVVLVDSVVRGGGVTRLLGADDAAGLAELAAGRRLGDVVRALPVSPGGQLSVVAVGDPQPPVTGLLSTPAYRRALRTIVASHELTVIDGESLLPFADASQVAREVAGVIVVVSPRTSERALGKVAQRLRVTSTPVLGYIVNRAATPRQRATWPRHQTQVRQRATAQRRHRAGTPSTRDERRPTVPSISGRDGTV